MNNRLRIKWIGMLALCVVFLTGCAIANPKEDNELAYRKAGIRALQKGEYETAVESFQKALDNSNGRISEVELDICYYKAYSQIMAGDTKGAMENYNALINYDSRNGKAYLLRGNLQTLLGQVNEACKDYDQAITYHTDSYDWYTYAYQQLSATGFETEGRTYLERALQLKGTKKENYRQRGQIYLLLGDLASAKEELSKAENLGDEEAKLYMAQALEQEGNIEAANAIYENYAKIHKGDAVACEKLAKVFVEEGRYEDALIYITQALQAKDVEDREALLKYEIVVQEKLGNFEAAKELLTAYMEEYPLDAKAQKELAFLMTR